MRKIWFLGPDSLWDKGPTKVEPSPDECTFSHGYEARLRVSFSSGRKIGRLTAYFRHETYPYAGTVAFVEDYAQRTKGSKTSMTLVSWLSDDLPTGRYVLQEITGVCLGGKKDGEEVLLEGSPSASFVLTDRAGETAAPKGDAPRVTGLTWG